MGRANNRASRQGSKPFAVHRAGALGFDSMGRHRGDRFRCSARPPSTAPGRPGPAGAWLRRCSMSVAIPHRKRDVPCPQSSIPRPRRAWLRPAPPCRRWCRPAGPRQLHTCTSATWSRGAIFAREQKPAWPTRLWFDDGEIVAWAWAWAQGRHRGRRQPVLRRRPSGSDQRSLRPWRWTGQRATNTAPVLGTIAYRGTTRASWSSALTRRGYRPRELSGLRPAHLSDLWTTSPPQELPKGFAALSMVEDQRRRREGGPALRQLVEVRGL